MSTAREKLLQQFRDLVEERLTRIAACLVKLESGADVEAARAALRDLHGLKGEARMMGFQDVNRVVHEMEELVRATEKGGYVLTPASIDALLAASDAVLTLAGTSKASPTPVDVAQVLEWVSGRTAAERSIHGVVVAGDPPPSSPGAPTASPPVGPPPSAPPPSAPSAPPPSAPSASAPTPRASGPRAGAPGQRAADARFDGAIRINQNDLDNISTLLGNLHQKHRAAEFAGDRRAALVRELRVLHRMAEDLAAENSELAVRLGRLKDLAAELHRDQKYGEDQEFTDLSALSEAVQAMRMLPLEVLFEPYTRVVRDLSRDLGKEVELTTDGEDTRVDRSVLEALKDPLLHLVRNSLDHGIESREERVEAGKSPRGSLRLSASREGDRLVLRVQDDGRGLDPARLRASAVRLGVVSAAEAESLPDANVMDLIFAPGFSSKESATDLSGRGVGLDVVKVKTATLGGEVTVHSTLGQQTTFELRVPLSLAVAPLLFVEAAGEQLCLPASSLRSAHRVEGAMVRNIAGRPALRVDEALIPFAPMSHLLGLSPERAASEGELVLVVRGRGQDAAVGVDRVLEERTQAVMPMRGVLSPYRHVSGATALGDGSLALVLSTAHLVSAASGQSLKIAGGWAKVETKKRHRILVVDDSPLTRDLITGLLEAVGYEVITANDGSDALDRLGRDVVDMVVTDLEMPNVDGLELTRRLKGHATLRSLPVVIITTRGSATDRQKGMEAGADGYITKGDLVRQDLVDVVARLLA